MKVKKYTGETMQDVVFQVKADLGPEAVIVNKRKFKKGGIFGFFAKDMFEVVAALEDNGGNSSSDDSENITGSTNIENEDSDVVEISSYNSAARSDSRENVQKTAAEDPENKNAIKEFIDDIKTRKKSEDEQTGFQNRKENKAQSAEDASNNNSAKNNFNKNLNKELNRYNEDSETDNYKQKDDRQSTEKKQLSAEQRLQNKFEDRNDKKQKSELQNSNQLYNYLLDQGVNSRNLNLFLKEMHNFISEDAEQEFAEKLKEFLKHYFADNSEIKVNKKQKIISFIGPTGVGKTTTMAKIAAHFAVDKDKNVALITADTYRIAAVEQLKTYSKIIDIPFAVCYSGSKLEDMLAGQFRNSDLILIDTPGSSWKDELQLDRLEDFVDRSLVDEVHLLLSLNTKSSDLKNIINKFSALNPDKALLTKLDETSSYGDIINIKEDYKLPLSYLTNGQDVPEDLETAEAETLYNYLFGDFYA